MTQQFSKGDKVTVREGATSIWGHKTDPKEVRTVWAVWSDGRAGLTPVWTGAPGNVFEPEDLVPHVETPGPLDPSKVKAGDTVTLDSDELVANVTGRVTDIQHDHGAWTIYLTLGVMGHSTPFVVGVGTSWRLTAHQPAPAPEPEWKPGTKGTGTINGREVGGFISEFNGAIGFYYWNEFAGHASYTGVVPEDFARDIVIDPADVDMEALLRAYAKGYTEGLSSEPRRDGLRAVLERLGLAK